MHLLALELVWEITLSKFENSPVLEEMAWGPGGWALATDNLFQIFGLTIIAVIEKEV